MLSGAAMPDPQCKAAAPPDGGRLASHTARRRPARAVAQVNASSPFLAVGRLLRSLRISRLGDEDVHPAHRIEPGGGRPPRRHDPANPVLDDGDAVGAVFGVRPGGVQGGHLLHLGLQLRREFLAFAFAGFDLGWSRPPWCRPRTRGPPSRCPRSRDETRPTPLSPGPSARGLAPGRHLSPASPGQSRRHQDRPRSYRGSNPSSAGGRGRAVEASLRRAGKSEPIRPPPQRRSALSRSKRQPASHPPASWLHVELTTGEAAAGGPCAVVPPSTGRRINRPALSTGTTCRVTVDGSPATMQQRRSC